MTLTRMRFFLTQINIKACAKNLVIPFSFITLILMLFVIDLNSFNYTWDWEKLTQKNLASLKKSRIVVIGIMASIPIVYVIGVNFLGLDQMLIGIDKQILTFWHFSLDNLQHRPISLEYLIFTIFFATTIWLAYEVDGLKQFSISLCLLGAIGTIYMIDIFYPYGAFTPFQAFVPFTASSAAQVLNWVGYETFFCPTKCRVRLSFTYLVPHVQSDLGWVGLALAYKASSFIPASSYCSLKNQQYL